MRRKKKNQIVTRLDKENITNVASRLKKLSVSSSESQAGEQDHLRKDAQGGSKHAPTPVAGARANETSFATVKQVQSLTTRASLLSTSMSTAIEQVQTCQMESQQFRDA